MKDIHIGSIIRRKLNESPLTIAEFAESINRTRPTVYDIFQRKSIDIDLLIRISGVLNYNFLREIYLSEIAKNNLSAPSASRYIVGVDRSKRTGFEAICQRYVFSGAEDY